MPRPIDVLRRRGLSRWCRCAALGRDPVESHARRRALASATGRRRAGGVAGDLEVWHVRAEAERQARAGVRAAADLGRRRRAPSSSSRSPRCRCGSTSPTRSPSPRRCGAGRRAACTTSTAPRGTPPQRILDAEQRMLAAAQRTDGRRSATPAGRHRPGRSRRERPAPQRGQAALVRTLATVRRPGAGRPRPGRHRQDHHHARARPRLERRRRRRSSAWRPPPPPPASSASDLGGRRHPRQAVRRPHRTTSPTAAVMEQRSGRARWSSSTRPAGRPRSTSPTPSTSSLDRGATVRLVGDDQQLAAVAAGGVLRDLAAPAAPRPCRRYAASPTRPKPQPPSPSAHGDTSPRSGSTPTTAASTSATRPVDDQAYAAWAGRPRRAGSTPAARPHPDLVTELNQRARADRLGRHATRAVRSRSSTAPVASAGDVIVTRRNERRLRSRDTDWVKNGDRWTVAARPPRRQPAAARHRPARQHAAARGVRRRARPARVRRHRPRRPGHDHRHLPHRRLRRASHGSCSTSPSPADGANHLYLVHRRTGLTTDAGIPRQDPPTPLDQLRAILTATAPRTPPAPLSRGRPTRPRGYTTRCCATRTHCRTSLSARESPSTRVDRGRCLGCRLSLRHWTAPGGTTFASGAN